MLVAVESFVTNDDWTGEVKVISGRTHVAEGSDLALRFPDRFKAAPGSRRGGRERIMAMSSAVPTVSRPAPPSPRLERWRLAPTSTPARREVELRESPAAHTVRIAHTARGDLIEVARAAGRLEDGGVVLATSRPSWCAEVDVVAITESGPNARREAHRYLADAVHDREAVERMHRCRDLVPVGGWHLHPTGDPTPSPADLEVWATMRAGLDLSAYVGLIVLPDAELGYDRATFAAWVVRAGRSTRCPDVCERAQLA